MSAGENRRCGGGDWSQQHGHTEVELGGLIVYGANHFKLLVITTRWPGPGKWEKGKK